VCVEVPVYGMANSLNVAMASRGGVRGAAPARGVRHAAALGVLLVVASLACCVEGQRDLELVGRRAERRVAHLQAEPARHRRAARAIRKRQAVSAGRGRRPRGMKAGTSRKAGERASIAARTCASEGKAKPSSWARPSLVPGGGNPIGDRGDSPHRRRGAEPQRVELPPPVRGVTWSHCHCPPIAIATRRLTRSYTIVEAASYSGASWMPVGHTAARCSCRGRRCYRPGVEGNPLQEGQDIGRWVETRRSVCTTALMPGPPSTSYFLVGGMPRAWQRSSWCRRDVTPRASRGGRTAPRAAPSGHPPV